MSNKQWVKVLISGVGILAFFLPWFGGLLIGNHSGFNIMNLAIKFGYYRALGMLILPLAFLVVILINLNVILKNSSGTVNKIIQFIPLILIAVSVYYSADMIKLNEEDFVKFDIKYTRNYRVGLYLTLISSFVLPFIPKSKAKPIQPYSLNNETEVS